MTYHVQFLLLVLAGWVNRQQQDVIDYLREENRVLRGGLRGKRLRLSDDDRRRLAVKAQALGREVLAEIASVATPATLLRWYLCSAKKKIGQKQPNIVGLERAINAGSIYCGAQVPSSKRPVAGAAAADGRLGSSGRARARQRAALSPTT